MADMLLRSMPGVCAGNRSETSAANRSRSQPSQYSSRGQRGGPGDVLGLRRIRIRRLGFESLRTRCSSSVYNRLLSSVWTVVDSRLPRPVIASGFRLSHGDLRWLLVCRRRGRRCVLALVCSYPTSPPYDVWFEAWVNALTWSWVSSRLAAWTSPVSWSVVRALAIGTLTVGWARNQASATAAIET